MPETILRSPKDEVLETKPSAASEIGLGNIELSYCLESAQEKKRRILI